MSSPRRWRTKQNARWPSLRVHARGHSSQRNRPSGNRVWSFGPTLRWNLFDGGRVRNRIEAEDARTEQALTRYENTVLNALEEMENAVVAYTEETLRRQALLRSVEAAKKSVELVQVLYKSGLTLDAAVAAMLELGGESTELAALAEFCAASNRSIIR